MSSNIDQAVEYIQARIANGKITDQVTFSYYFNAAKKLYSVNVYDLSDALNKENTEV
jgi:hypothetical protein